MLKNNDFDLRYLFILDLVKKAGLMAKNEKDFTLKIKDGDLRNVITEVDLKIDKFIKVEILKFEIDANIYSEEDDISEIQNLAEDQNKANKDVDKQSLWTIDPIDGTSNFFRGIPHYATCISIIEGEECILGACYNPCTDELFSFQKGIGAYLNGKKLENINNKNIEINKAVIVFNDGRDEDRRAWMTRGYVKIVDKVKSMKAFGSSSLDMVYVGAGRFDAFIYAQLNTFDIAFAIGFVREVGGVVRDEKGADVKMSKENQKVITTANENLYKEIMQMIN